MINAGGRPIGENNFDGVSSMKKSTSQKITAVIVYVSMFLPLFALSNNSHHHDCVSDECMRIIYHDTLGMCIEDAIDTLCLIVAVGVNFIIIGSAIVWSKQKDALSPFVIMGLITLIAIYSALMDPAKCMFAVSVLIPFAFMIIAFIMDNKEKQKKNDE